MTNECLEMNNNLDLEMDDYFKQDDNFTEEDIKNALSKLPADQRESVLDLADEDLLQYLPLVDEDAIPEIIQDSMVDTIVDAITPHIRHAILGCTLGLNHYFAPFKNYRKLILEEREKAGKHNEESC